MGRGRRGGDGGSWFGLRRPSAGGLGWACAVVPPAHPPTLLETGGLPLYPRRGLRPLHPAWGTGALAFARMARWGPLPNLAHTWGQGQRHPRGVLERGMGPLRRAIQRGHRADIAQSSAVVARSWPRQPLGRGVMACSPPAPPSDVCQKRGTRCTPGGSCARCPLRGERRQRRLLTWRVGVCFLTFPRVWGRWVAPVAARWSGRACP